MAKKELKDKIELTIFWLGLFCITYLILGFILKSDLTKPIDSSIFYEVLKDSLTITAAFLAPIAALILFSDWRVEHRLKNNEELSKTVIKETQYLISETFNIFWKLLNIDILSKKNLPSYISLVADLEEKSNEIKISLKDFSNVDPDDEFINSIEQILKLLDEVSSNFYKALMSFENRQITYSGDFSIEFGRYYDETHMKLNLINDLLDTSKALAKKFNV
ncbi:hypothetical protein ACKENX_17350 [Acinetobacter baumannii]|uniref:hypothetical protein n=2 Tax=Acinetobacter baumannii TaxID=470 RepID=UPI0038B44925